MITQLYLVTDITDDDDSLDLFVSAHDVPEAIDLWRRHWIDSSYIEPGTETAPIVFKVPTLSETPRAHPWHVEVVPQFEREKE